MSAPGPRTWSNWSGGVTAEPAATFAPTALEGILDAIRWARERGSHVRVVGTGHSFVPLCASSGALVSLSSLQGVLSVDDEGRARVLAGTKIYQLSHELRKRGWALQNMGDIDRQSVAGAVSTATHGTGPELRNLSAQLESVTLATAEGRCEELSNGRHREAFDAARVSLGALGILVDVTLRCIPSYRLHERLWTEPVEAHLEKLDLNVAENRHYEFFYDPTEDVANAKALNPTDAPPDPLPDVPGQRIGHSDLILPTARWRKFNEMEFSLPAANGRNCFCELRHLMRHRHPEIRWPLEYRTVAGDDAWLSPHEGRDSVTISCHEDHRRDPAAFFRDCEAIFREHGGRPHWGKMHGYTANDLRRHYPRWDDFCSLREEWDPDATFLNAYLRELFVA